ncbi:unnamed protein product [Coffea canephora]|uniref:Auxin-responsive protein n=1 Tax=Coffea canephora TaxID=49390 RepID=A0A068TPA1_COFCA|nr:unnamed protein product [Coffea canephora]
MSSDKSKVSPESYSSAMNFEETELSLGLPGGPRVQNCSRKRSLSGGADLRLGCSSSGQNETSDPTTIPPAKAQVVGWPPVKSSRRNMMKSGSKYVKVAVDGAPYLRKVDLEMYNGYQQLLGGLEGMFTCQTICNGATQKKLMDPANGMQYVPTYEDKDGDWMLVGDVPWKMFVESCKRLRLMKSSEAIELATRTPPNCSSTC